MSNERLIQAIIAMHEAGFADEADHIAITLGDDVRYGYYCWCYGPMTREFYWDMLEAGEQYAADYAAKHPQG